MSLSPLIGETEREEMIVKRHVGLFAVMALFILCTAAQDAFGDGKCTSLSVYKAYFDKGVSAEKSGKPAEAFDFYYRARSDGGCEGKNPVSDEAKAGWKRVGQRAGEEAEKKGNLGKPGAQVDYNDKEVFTYKDGMHRINEGAGAFAWYRQIGDYADADRVAMKLARTKPDLKTFQPVFEYFEGRKINSALESEKAEPEPAVDPVNLKELQNIAARQGEDALNREVREVITADKTVGTPFEDPIGLQRQGADVQKRNASVERSMAQLELARKWFVFFEAAKEKQVVEIAEKRGDVLYAGDGLSSLENAKKYYKFAGNEKKVQLVRDKANRLCAAFEKKGGSSRLEEKANLEDAMQYCDIADNDAKSDQITARLGKLEEELDSEDVEDEELEKSVDRMYGKEVGDMFKKLKAMEDDEEE